MKHAVDELRSLVDRIYYIVRALFPALPQSGYQHYLLDNDSVSNNSESGEDARGQNVKQEVVVTATSIIYPHILPKIHSSVFMLYALYYKKDDDEYWARILKWNRHPDLALLSFLAVDQKFWRLDARSIASARDLHFCKGTKYVMTFLLWSEQCTLSQEALNIITL